MTHYYMMIDAPKSIDRNSKFIKIKVGASRQGIKDLEYIEQWANNNGAFLHVSDEECSEFINKIALSLSMRVFELPAMVISSSALLHYIKEHNATPVIPDQGREATKLKEILIPTRYLNKQIRVIQRAEAKQRNKPKSMQVDKKGS